MNTFRFPFDPELLTTFLAIAQSGRISAAARALNISQPSATAHLQKLEEELRTQLFERSVNGVTLTSAGEKLLDHARKIHGLLEEAASQVSEAKVIRGHLTVAASTTIATHILPAYLVEFRKRYPQIQFSLEIANTEDVLKKIRTRQTPLGLVEGHARSSAARLEPFIDDEIVLVTSSQSSVTARKSSDLKGQVLLMREQGSGTRAVIERAFKKVHLRQKDFAECIDIGSSEAIKSAVIAGLGIAFVSRSSIQNELALGKLVIVPLSDLKISRTFYWALPSGGPVGPAAEFHRFVNQRKGL